MRLKKFLDLWLKLALMIDKAWEKFEKKIEKEERIKKIKSEYYAKIDAEISEKMQQTTNNWKNITEKQKEINKKETGYYETNLERKKRENLQEKEINKKETGYYETNLERKKREDSVRKKKISKRNIEITKSVQKRPGIFCIFCKTKVDDQGFCYC